MLQEFANQIIMPALVEQGCHAVITRPADNALPRRNELFAMFPMLFVLFFQFLDTGGQPVRVIGDRHHFQFVDQLKCFAGYRIIAFLDIILKFEILLVFVRSSVPPFIPQIGQHQHSDNHGHKYCKYTHSPLSRWLFSAPWQI